MNSKKEIAEINGQRQDITRMNRATKQRIAQLDNEINMLLVEVELLKIAKGNMNACIAQRTQEYFNLGDRLRELTGQSVVELH